MVRFFFSQVGRHHDGCPGPAQAALGGRGRARIYATLAKQRVKHSAQVAQVGGIPSLANRILRLIVIWSDSSTVSPHALAYSGSFNYKIIRPLREY